MGKRLNNLLFYFGVLCAVLGANTAAAQSEAGRDHPLLERFGESTIIDYDRQSGVNYRLVLGNLRRIRGLVVAEEEERLRGDLTRITYEIPDSFSGRDVMAFFRAQAEQRGYANLFSCQGRGCGNSNYWANDVFDDRSLYGPERNQYYMAFQAESAAAYLVVYVITRANRRLYAHVEVLETASSGTLPMIEFSLENLLDAGGLRLYNLSFGSGDRLTGDDGLLPAVRLLQANPTLEIYIVAHLPGPAPLETLLEQSAQRARSVRDALIARGIDGRRIVARGVGPLAPLCSEGDCRERVEMVLR